MCKLAHGIRCNILSHNFNFAVLERWFLYDYDETECSFVYSLNNTMLTSLLKQDAQLSQRDRAAGCVTVFAKSRRLELGDNILRTL